MSATKPFRIGKRDDGGSARRFSVPKPKGARVQLPADHKALTNGRTLFPTRVMHASTVPRLLISGHNAAKIGKSVDLGRWRGMPVYTLTLEERATCPTTCREWTTCYGNNMHMARRIIADSAFERRLWAELQNLDGIHQAGFVVRLHILGDFYSQAYVDLWDRALDTFAGLNVYGYSARNPDTDEIGSALWALSVNRWKRFAVRFSGSAMPERSTLVVNKAADVPVDAILCPAQTGKTERCGTCGLCWQSKRPVAFLRH